MSRLHELKVTLAYTVSGIVLWIGTSWILSLAGVPDSIAIGYTTPLPMIFLFAGAFSAVDWFNVDAWRDEKPLRTQVWHGVIIIIVTGLSGIPVITLLPEFGVASTTAMGAGLLVEFAVGWVVILMLNGQYVDQEALEERYPITL